MPDAPVSHPPENRCCQCGRDIELNRHLDEQTGLEDERWRLINGGGRLEMSFGYGSCHDLRNFVIYICDTCVPVFIDSCKTKVGEFSCLGYDQDKALTSNVVVDQDFSDKHHARLEADGVKRVTVEEMREYLAEPVDQPPELSPFETYWRLNEELGRIRSEQGGQESYQEEQHLKKMEEAWERLIKASPPQVYHNWKLARSAPTGKLSPCQNPPGDG